MTPDHMPPAGGESNPVVFVDHGQPRTTSLDVAAYFGKRHADVVRVVRALLAAQAGLDERTFALIEYTDDQGRRQPAYNMDRDGFTLVAMGFTGPNTLGFKWAYIQAFNRMEVELRANRSAPIHSPEHREFPDWPLDEMRVKQAVANMYRMAYGPLTAQWVIPLMGFPAPPATMIELGRQLLLDLDGGGPKPNPKDPKDE